MFSVLENSSSLRGRNARRCCRNSPDCSPFSRLIFKTSPPTASLTLLSLIPHTTGVLRIYCHQPYVQQRSAHVARRCDRAVAGWHQRGTAFPHSAIITIPRARQRHQIHTDCGTRHRSADSTDSPRISTSARGDARTAQSEAALYGGDAWRRHLQNANQARQTRASSR